MKKRMLMLRGKSLRGDATFKVSKRFVDQGMRSLKAIYSVMNEVRYDGRAQTPQPRVVTAMSALNHGAM